MRPAASAYPSARVTATEAAYFRAGTLCSTPCVRLRIPGNAMNAPNTPEDIKPAKPDQTRNGGSPVAIPDSACHQTASPKSARPPRSGDLAQQPETTQQVRNSCKQSLAGMRLRKHADYQRAYAGSRKRQSASMSWFLAPRSVEMHPAGNGALRAGEAPGRVGLTAGKVLGKAHERNRIKRRMREVLRRHLDLLPDGADLILHPRRTVLTMEFTKLEAEIVRILTQARADAARFALRPALVPPA